jgi:hypothetical protein
MMTIWSDDAARAMAMELEKLLEHGERYEIADE